MNPRLRKLAALSVILLLGGCATPGVVTPKPDIRPVQVSHQQAQASVGRARENVGQLKRSQAKEQDAIQKATAALDKVTGADKAITDAKAALYIVQQQFIQSQQYSQWAADELEKAWAYETTVGETLGTLGTQINDAHRNEQELSDWKKANEPVITQVNSWWGLGAFGYGAKVLAKHLLVLALVGTGVAVALFVLSMFFPVIGIGLKLAGGFLSGLFTKLRGIFNKR